MTPIEVLTQGSYLVVGNVRVHVDTEHVDLYQGQTWQHMGSIQALRDNPKDFALHPRTIERLDAIWEML